MRATEGLRSEQLTAALDEAIGGKPERLYGQLGVVSGLPGKRANLAIAQAFATECASRGKKADRLLFDMVALSLLEAPGATEREFLPLCAVLALGERGASDPSLRKRVIQALHDSADDPRFRVREVVPVALARLGERMGEELVHFAASWMDGFFQATAVLLALTDNAWLSTLDDPAPVIERLDEAYLLAKKAPRSAARWPGRKALVEALGIAPGAIAARFGVPIFDRLAAWSNTEMPELREAVETSLRSGKLTGRFAPEISRVRDALTASIPPPRDPTLAVQGMRSRGKKRGRR